ncbi:DUF4019 domain-containing protein [Variovorax paradoxus]|uniref:DUF4019 domain-containing protein n=1 Tax=Variovorax paradoxus TaxID=34073 RepID=UPI0029C66B33|nr:DUF4019 domain-containing protein [Variovorax paradoxus]
MKHISRIIAAAAFSGWLALASAQPAQEQLDLNALQAAGVQIAQAVDRNQAAVLWDGASPAAKRVVTREAFVASLQRSRAALGAVASRTWLGLSRQFVGAGDKLPPGAYINIDFVTTFAEGKTQRELVSLRQDEDKVWRFVGYVVR